MVVSDTYYRHPIEVGSVRRLLPVEFSADAERDADLRSCYCGYLKTHPAVRVGFRSSATLPWQMGPSDEMSLPVGEEDEVPSITAVAGTPRRNLSWALPCLNGRDEAVMIGWVVITRSEGEEPPASAIVFGVGRRSDDGEDAGIVITVLSPQSDVIGGGSSATMRKMMEHRN
ncbi:hypothetical protein ACLOJK_019023 [Asimina triloba]